MQIGILERVLNWPGHKLSFFVYFAVSFFISFFTEEIMARPYSLDLRERVLQFYDAGYEYSEITISPICLNLLNFSQNQPSGQ